MEVFFDFSVLLDKTFKIVFSTGLSLNTNARVSQDVVLGIRKHVLEYEYSGVLGVPGNAGSLYRAAAGPLPSD